MLFVALAVLFCAFWGRAGWSGNTGMTLWTIHYWLDGLRLKGWRYRGKRSGGKLICHERLRL